MSRINRRSVIFGVPAALVAGAAIARAEAAKADVLIVIGPSGHPPGTHEVAAGARLMKHCLETSPDLKGIRAEVVAEWPKVRPAAKSVVFIGDMFPPAVMPEPERIMGDLKAMMAAGCGLVCVHYATGLEAKHVAEDGEHPLLHWMGGYFATRCKHHQSVARVFPKATVEPAAVEHPVNRGWKTFTVNDEPYIKNYFGKNGPAKNVSILATSLLPPEDPKAEAVAWAATRPDGGRGVGSVMPHFYRNWKQDDMRTLIVNAIAWTAKAEIPKGGVRSTPPDLTAFKPASVEPIPRPKK
jgi:type 1 glutamine amidotransferase